jgi:hypothetical protein
LEQRRFKTCRAYWHGLIAEGTLIRYFATEQLQEGISDMNGITLLQPQSKGESQYTDRIMAIANAMAQDGVPGLIVPTMTDALCKITMAHCSADDIALRLESSADTLLALAAAVRNRLANPRLSDHPTTPTNNT